MKIDTKEMEHSFTIMDIDGLVLVNPREIGIEVALQNISADEIWTSDLHYQINEYLADIVNEAFNTCKNTLKENNREIDVEK